MGTRFTKYPQGYYLISCDVCCKTDTDELSNTSKLGIMWNDTDTGNTLCDDCKKTEEKRRALCEQET